MKTILPILLLAACFGCGKPAPKLSNPYTVVTGDTGLKRDTIEEIESVGHKYLVVRGSGIAIIHAEHCLNHPATNKVQLVSP